MDQTALSQQLSIAVRSYASEKGMDRSDVISLLQESTQAARSTIRQDLGGYIKQPSLERLSTYADVLGWDVEVFLDVAKAEGREYDAYDQEKSDAPYPTHPPWDRKKGRDSARSPSDIQYSGTTRREWEPPNWSEWQEELDYDGSWDEAPEEVRQSVVQGTLLGEASAETYGEANYYPLREPSGELNFNALDAAWKLAGRSPDPQGTRSTVESLANSAFDHSFMDEGKASPDDLSVGDKVGWSTSNDEINTYGTVRSIQTEGTASPEGSDYSLEASDEEPVFWTEVYDPDEEEHTGEETIHRASELTPMDDFPESRSKDYQGVSLSVPDKIQNAAQAFLDAKEEGWVNGSCGTGTGTKRARKIASDDLSWKDFLTRDNGTPIPAYLTSHEEDVSADGSPTGWSEEEWSDCGNAQMAAWGFYGDWFRDKANELARARDEDEPYKSDSTESVERRGAPEIMIDIDVKDFLNKTTTAPFADKIQEDDTEFRGDAKAEVKDVDRSNNIITGYYAAWTPDADGDRFQKGAFEESIKKYGPTSEKPRIVHLNQHMVKQPIGVPIRLEEDDHGLRFQTMIAETRRGKDVMELYDAGVITEHSVGFKRLEEEETRSDYNIISKALLLEGSNVTWGANSDTPFTGFKSTKDAFESLVEYMGRLRAALKQDLSLQTAKKVSHGLQTVEDRLSDLMEEAGKSIEEDTDANADALTQDELDVAIRNFKSKINIFEDTNAKDPLKQGRVDGITIPDFSGVSEGKDERTAIDTDYRFFGGTNG